jgi:hypothetical protein
MSRELFSLDKAWAIYEVGIKQELPGPVVDILKDVYYLGAFNLFKAMEGDMTAQEALTQVSSLRQELYAHLAVNIRDAMNALNLKGDAPTDNRGIDSTISSLNAIFKAKEPRS